jgi:hypothetical protein
VIGLDAYVVLISHLRTSLRPVIVAARVGRQGLQTLAHTYPEAIGPPILGEQQFQITRRLRALLVDLLQTVPAQRRPVIERELALLTQSVGRGFADDEDQARANEPDHQGIGSSPKRSARPAPLAKDESHGAKVKTRFQSFFMLMTVQPFLTASSYSAWVKVPILVLGNPRAGP